MKLTQMFCSLGCLGLASLITIPCAGGATFGCTSPDGKLVFTLEDGAQLQYSVTYGGAPLITASPIGLSLRAQGELGKDAKSIKVAKRDIDETLHPVVAAKNSVIPDQCQEMLVTFEGGYAVRARAYNDGAAYRIETSFDGMADVLGETFAANFPGDHMLYLPDETSLMTHQERQTLHMRLSEVPKGKFAYPPVIVDIENGPKIAITESDLYDYAGLYLEGTGSPQLTGLFPAVAVEEKQIQDRNVEVVKRADYIARTDGTRNFPWRVFVVAAEDADLIRTEMVYKLARPLALEDTDWIRPGKVAWDWYNANNIFGVDFRAGVNTETYKYYIDFAAENGIEYVILDEGWYVLPDLLKIAPGMNVEEIVAYGKKKGVDIIPWVVWKSLEDQLEPAMEQFERWGVAGIKVDFMQRDDQWMVNYYWRIAKEAAKRRLLVDYHGAFKPTGLRRAYPNVISREGVQGAEHNKWSSNSTPHHNVTLPFMRMLAGPMDYTPGAMRNVQAAEHQAIFNRPMSMGTRCHQLGMYVVFESPLQMLCENPAIYKQEPECMRFLDPVPTVWDKTVVLDAKFGEYVLVARRHGEDWWVGAMTDAPRELTLDLSFLGGGGWNAEIWQDGINADNYAEDFKYLTEKVNAARSIQIKMAPGGGFAAHISK